MSAVGPWPRAMNAAAVAHPSAASMKNCHGSRPPAPRASVASCLSALSVEIAELIVDPVVQRCVDRGSGGDALVGLPRPLHGDERNRHRAAETDEVGKHPGHAVEALVDRRAQHFLAAVL